MTDEPHTDQTDAATELKLLAKTRGRLIACAAHESDALFGDDGDAKARKISAIVIALVRITEMEDRYERRRAEAGRTIDAHARSVANLRAQAERLISLPDAEFRAEYARILSDAARESEASCDGFSGAEPPSVEGAGA